MAKAFMYCLNFEMLIFLSTRRQRFKILEFFRVDISGFFRTLTYYVLYFLFEYFLMINFNTAQTTRECVRTVCDQQEHEHDSPVRHV